MISLEAIIVVAGWLVSMAVALFVVPNLAARRTLARFGLKRVVNDAGVEIYAAMDPDGEPVKVPVARVGKDGKVTVKDEYAPLAYALPTIAAMQVKASFQGKVGKMTQMANEAVLEGMDINQAATAMALQAFARGQYGKAMMAYLAPRIAAALNASGNAGQQQMAGNKGGGPI